MTNPDSQTGNPGHAEFTVSEAIQYRRSVRVYDSEKAIDATIVKKCLEQAALAPNSSNMQLWEFYHITDSDVLAKMAPLCFNQNAARTAKQLVVFVTRKDLWRKRAKANLDMIETQFPLTPGEKPKGRAAGIRTYYKKLIPFLYGDLLGMLGLIRWISASVTGLFRPIYRQVCPGDMRVVVHKTCGLAAQTFMLSMAAVGYDTCPMEGFDSRRVKKLLGLPSGAEINMVVSCGIRKPNGIYGERFRVPFTEVYKNI
jgi:nitroreductase